MGRLVRSPAGRRAAGADAGAGVGTVDPELRRPGHRSGVALRWLADLRRRLVTLAAPGDRRPRLVYFLHDEVIVETPTEVSDQVEEAVPAAAHRAGSCRSDRSRSSSCWTSPGSAPTRTPVDAAQALGTAMVMISDAQGSAQRPGNEHCAAQGRSVSEHRAAGTARSSEVRPGGWSSAPRAPGALAGAADHDQVAVAESVADGRPAAAGSEQEHAAEPRETMRPSCPRCGPADGVAVPGDGVAAIR